jgi:hypothetical protein
LLAAAALFAASSIAQSTITLDALATTNFFDDPRPGDRPG